MAAPAPVRLLPKATSLLPSIHATLADAMSAQANVLEALERIDPRLLDNMRSRQSLFAKSHREKVKKTATLDFTRKGTAFTFEEPSKQETTTHSPVEKRKVKKTVAPIVTSSQPEQMAKTNRLKGPAFGKAATDRSFKKVSSSVPQLQHRGAFGSASRRKQGGRSTSTGSIASQKSASGDLSKKRKSGSRSRSASNASGISPVVDKAGKESAKANHQQDLQKQMSADLIAYLPHNMVFRDPSDVRKRYTMREQAEHVQRRKTAETMIMEMRFKERNIAMTKERLVDLRAENTTLVEESRRIQKHMNTLLEVVAKESNALDQDAIKSMHRIKKSRKKIRNEIQEVNQQLGDDIVDLERDIKEKTSEEARLLADVKDLQEYEKYMDQSKLRQAILSVEQRHKSVVLKLEQATEEAERQFEADKDAIVRAEEEALANIIRRELQRDDTMMPVLLLELDRVERSILEVEQLCEVQFAPLDALECEVSSLQHRCRVAQQNIKQYDQDLYQRKAAELQAEATEDSEEEME